MARGQVTLTYNRFPEIAARFPRAVGAIVRQTARDVEKRAKVAIQSGNKTGRIYYHTTKGKRRVYATIHYEGGKRREWTGQMRSVTNRVAHQASAPGQAPATDTGELVNSISVEMTGQTTAVVGVGAEYGEALEFGTARMAARPFLTPAVEGARPRFENEMRDLESKLK